MIGDIGFVLHKRSYKDSSEIIKLLCQEQGVIDVMANGSKRPKSKFRNQLHPFIETNLSFSGKSSLKTLTMAEQVGVAKSCPYLNQVSMMYCNELMQLLSMDQQTAVAVYPLYKTTIASLSSDEPVVQVLRRFEWRLCALLGYELSIPAETMATDLLQFDPNNGLIIHANNGCQMASYEAFIHGESLTADQWKDVSFLMRQVINHMVHGKPIKSRQLLL